MILCHPNVAFRSCEECAKWLYDDKPEGMGSKRVQKAGRDVRRPVNVQTPCHQCPKESPKEAEKYELKDKNIRTLVLYFQQKATGGFCLTEAERSDPIIRRNMGIIEQEFYKYGESKRDEVASLLPVLIAKGAR